MKIEFSNQPNYPIECALLLMRALCPPGSDREDYTALGVDDEITRYCALHAVPRGEPERMAAPLRAVQDHVMAHLTTPRDRLEFFFREIPGEALVVGWFVAFWISLGVDLGALSPAECRRTVCADLFEEMFLTPPDALPEDEAGLIALLDGANCSDAARWRFLTFSRHAAEYQREVAAILEEAKGLFLQQRAVWQPLFDEATARLQKNIGDKGIDYFNEKYHVKFSGEAFRFFPSLSGFNRISLFSSGKDVDRADIVYGVYMDAALARTHDADVYAVCQSCKALGDQKRFEILLALRQKALCGQEIAARTGLSAGTVSHHMNELVSSGFVTLVKEGTRINYTLSAQGLERFFGKIRRLLL